MIRLVSGQQEGPAAVSGTPPVALLSPVALMLFFAVLIALAWCSFHGFERPLRRRIGRCFLQAGGGA